MKLDPRPHIAVIDPGVKKPELVSFNYFARRSPVPMTYHLPALHGLDSLRAVENPIAGIIIMGSASSVHDGHPWQRELAKFLTPLIEKGTPTFGICFGHQYLAHLAGARIGYVFADRKKHVGFRKVKLEPNPLWENRAQEIHVAVSHNEMVLDVPKGYRRTGTSPEIAIECLTHETLPIWTFQFHPEATMQFLEKRLPEFTSTCPVDPSQFDSGHTIVSAFLSWVATRPT